MLIDADLLEVSDIHNSAVVFCLAFSDYSYFDKVDFY